MVKGFGREGEGVRGRRKVMGVLGEEWGWGEKGVGSKGGGGSEGREGGFWESEKVPGRRFQGGFWSPRLRFWD